MRPVDKGKSPSVYSHYREAASDLVTRLGDYCSYCERQIETHLAVEHVQPKSHHDKLRNEWSNLLLGCVNCNSIKGNEDVALDDYFWPDRDNTLRALQYLEGGVVEPRAGLAPEDHVRAKNTITLTGLDKDPGNSGREPTDSDRRWSRRRENWQLATMLRQKLADEDTDTVRELIVWNVTARGMFSIWWTVFDGDLDMRRRLREAIVGTDAGSFSANENLVQRKGGQL